MEYKETLLRHMGQWDQQKNGNGQMKTNADTVRLLSKNVVSRLENHKAIVFNPLQRQTIVTEVFELMRPFVWTDDDLSQKAFDAIGQHAEQIAEQKEHREITETEQYKTSLSVMKVKFGNDKIAGFYFQQAPKMVAEKIIQYFLESKNIEDVFETDLELQKRILMIFKNFSF